MTVLVVAVTALVAFGLSLAVFAYFFNRFMGAEDTVNLALTMHEINATDHAVPARKARAAGAA